MFQKIILPTILLICCSFAHADEAVNSFCNRFDNFTKVIITERLDKPNSYKQLKSALREEETSNDFWSGILVDFYEDTVESAYQQEEPIDIKTFVSNTHSKCLSQIALKRNRRLKKLNQRLDSLESKAAGVVNITSSKTGYNQTTYTAFCRYGGQSSIIVTGDDLQWIDKSGNNYYSNTFKDTIESAANKGCK